MKSSAYDEVWGYPCEQIREYLLSQGAAAVGDTYTLDDCIVTLESLPDRKAGKLSFAQTRVCIKGSGADAFHHRFKLRFLKGGA